MHYSNLLPFFFTSSIYHIVERFTVVIDAGSSGSRAALYTYMQEIPNALPDALLTLSSTETLPGISSIPFPTFPEYLQTLFFPLLEHIEQLSLSPIELAEIPVYFYATAGMRTLSPTQQKKIYNAIKTWICNPKNTPFKTVEVRSITGYE